MEVKEEIIEDRETYLSIEQEKFLARNKEPQSRIEGNSEKYILPAKEHPEVERARRGDETLMGTEFGFTVLDKHLRFKPNSFLLVVGNPNVGKTTFLIFLLVRLAKQGKKFLIYSQENDEPDLQITIYEHFIGKKIEAITDQESQEAFKFYSDHFRLVSDQARFNYQEILNLARDFKKKWDYDGFLIDPYNGLKVETGLIPGISSHEYHYEVASDFLTFSRNTVSLIVNCHTVTEIQRRIVNKGITETPMLSHVEGGAKFTSKCDDGIVIHRQTLDPQRYIMTEIHVRKIRKTRTGGRPTAYSDPVLMKMTQDGTFVEESTALDIIR